MFGYIVVNRPELKIREFDRYRGYYCGLCKTLQAKYGIKGQCTLNYDMTFLSILLTALYEEKPEERKVKCIVHPLTEHTAVSNSLTEYVADMNILLSYYKCLDDYKDDKSIKAAIMSDLLKKAGKKVSARYPDKSAIVESELNKLAEYEKSGEKDLDTVSGCFGRMMIPLFVYRHDEWEEQLTGIGFYLGKFIYILDAFIDLEEDAKKNRYNPLAGSSYSEADIKNILTMMMAEVSKAFEMLPVVDELGILENIIYGGVWSEFNRFTAKKENKNA